MHSKNVTITQLNDLINEKNGTDYTVQNLSRRLNKDDLKFSDAEDILNILGYKIEIKEKERKIDERFLFKDYKPEPSEQLEMTLEYDEDTLNPILINEIETTIHKEVKKKIEHLVSSQVEKYFINFTLNNSPHADEFKSKDTNKK